MSHYYSLWSKSLLSIFNRTNWADQTWTRGVNVNSTVGNFKKWLQEQSSMLNQKTVHVSCWGLDQDLNLEWPNCWALMPGSAQTTSDCGAGSHPWAQVEENRCFCWWQWQRQEKLLWHTFKVSLFILLLGSVYFSQLLPHVNPALVCLALALNTNLALVHPALKYPSQPSRLEPWPGHHKHLAHFHSAQYFQFYMYAITHSLAHGLTIILFHPNLCSVSSIGLIESTRTWNWGVSVQHHGEFKIWLWEQLLLNRCHLMTWSELPNCWALMPGSAHPTSGCGAGSHPRAKAEVRGQVPCLGLD